MYHVLHNSCYVHTELTESSISNKQSNINSWWHTRLEPTGKSCVWPIRLLPNTDVHSTSRAPPELPDQAAILGWRLEMYYILYNTLELNNFCYYLTSNSWHSQSYFATLLSCLKVKKKKQVLSWTGHVYLSLPSFCMNMHQWSLVTCWAVESLNDHHAKVRNHGQKIA